MIASRDVALFTGAPEKLRNANGEVHRFGCRDFVSSLCQARVG